MSTYTETRTLVTIECAGCGVLFAVTKAYDDRRREDHKTFYCPNGHHNYFSGPSKKDQEIAQLKREREEAERTATRALQAQASAERSLKASVKEAKRVKKRVHNGVCPCCNRHFVNLERHMKTKHAEEIQK